MSICRIFNQTTKRRCGCFAINIDRMGEKKIAFVIYKTIFWYFEVLFVVIFVRILEEIANFTSTIWIGIFVKNCVHKKTNYKMSLFGPLFVASFLYDTTLLQYFQDLISKIPSSKYVLLCDDKLKSNLIAQNFT